MHGGSTPGRLGQGEGGGGEAESACACNPLARGGGDGDAPPSMNHPAGQERPSDEGLKKAGSDADVEDASICWSSTRPRVGGVGQKPAPPLGRPGL